MKVQKMKSISSALVLFLSMLSLTALCAKSSRADGDVALPPSAPTPPHAEALAQSRSQSCTGLRNLTRSKLIQLSKQGLTDYQLLCNGVPNTTDAEISNAVSAVSEGLSEALSSTSQISEQEKIADTAEKLNTLQHVVTQGAFGGYADQDQQIFTSAAGAF